MWSEYVRHQVTRTCLSCYRSRSCPVNYSAPINSRNCPKRNPDPTAAVIAARTHDLPNHRLALASVDTSPGRFGRGPDVRRRRFAIYHRRGWDCLSRRPEALPRRDGIGTTHARASRWGWTSGSCETTSRLIVVRGERVERRRRDDFIAVRGDFSCAEDVGASPRRLLLAHLLTYLLTYLFVTV